MRIALDTNPLTDLAVLGEMKAGFYGGTRQAQNEALLSSLVARENCGGSVPPGRETAEHYARLFVQLKRAGTPIPDNDLWIAALAIEHDLVLITRDRHFEKLPQLRRAAV
jgi:predicted nucleic acid-binding protein